MPTTTTSSRSTSTISSHRSPIRLPGNAHPISDAPVVRIDQVVIGTCTNGWIEDMRQAADVLRGQKVAQGVRCIIVPGSQLVYKQALREGLIEVFAEADCIVSTSTCGPCIGGHMGVLGENEVCVSTTNRNFVGRMGARSAQIYLANPAVAAASAVAGELAGPRPWSAIARPLPLTEHRWRLDRNDPGGRIPSYAIPLEMSS